MKTRTFSLPPSLKPLLSLCLALCLLTAVRAPADEIRYPVPSYEGEQLTKLREWENQWVGKKVNHTSIDGVKDFIPESLYRIIKDPAPWGETWFEIVPYREIKPTEGEIAFTRKYAGTCSIGPGDELLNYVCGIPFPNPTTGLEIACNFDNLNQGDNAHAVEEVVLIDAKQRYDRTMGVDAHFLYYAGRREVPPTPAVTPNPRGIFRANHSSYFDPASMKGTRSMSLKFIDRSQPYESWNWSSTTRKLTRKSTAQRTATQGGSDTSSDDQNIYDNAIQFMNYRYLGRKELLIARHQDAAQIKKGHREGYCLFDGMQRERINMYVVECIHKDPEYIYSKQIWYVDPETWLILYSDKYDREGKLCKVFENAQFVVNSVYSNAPIGIMAFVSVIDVTRFHGTAGFSNYTLGAQGEFYQPDYYTPKALQKFGY